jgi:hypothetical protein
LFPKTLDVIPKGTEDQLVIPQNCKQRCNKHDGILCCDVPILDLCLSLVMLFEVRDFELKYCCKCHPVDFYAFVELVLGAWAQE